MSDPSQAKIVASVDPGSRTAGVAIYDQEHEKFLDFVLIPLKTSDPFDKRLWEYYQIMAKLLRKVEPDLVIIEQMFMKSNVAVAMKLAKLVAVTEIAAHQVGAEIAIVGIRTARAALKSFGGNYTRFGVTESTKNEPDILSAVELCLGYHKVK